MNKKIIALLAAASMVFGLSACGNKALPSSSTPVTPSEPGVNEPAGALTPEEGAKLTLWVDNEVYAKAISEGFMAKYPGVTVEFEKIGSVDTQAKMELDGPAGKGADVFVAPHDGLSKVAASGIADPILPAVAANLNATLNPNALKTVTIDGQLRGVPISIETMAMFYNKDIVKEPVTTFDEMATYAKEYNNKKDNKFAFLYEVNNGYDGYAFLTPYGFKLFGENGTDDTISGFESEAFLKGLEFVKSLKEIIPINSGDLTGDFITEQFKTGKTPYIIAGPWKIEEFKKDGVNFGVSPLPSVNGTPLTPFSGVQVAYPSAFSEYPVASQLLAEYMASAEGAQLLYNSVNKIPAILDTNAITGLKDDADLNVIIEQFNNSFPMPSAKRMDYYWAIAAKTLAIVFDQQSSPEEAVASAQKEWNSLVASE